jgi:spore coat protein U-like protein
MGRTRIAFLVAAVAVAAARPAAAQQTNTINATATVVTPLSVASVNSLAFGTVYPGVNKAVDYDDATNGGKFSVAGYAGAQVTLSFTLPPTLAGPAGATLPIDTWSAYHNTANDATSGGTTFDPSLAGPTTALSGSGNLYVFLGARVTPAPTQAAGAYTSTVTMTVAYTGS